MLFVCDVPGLESTLRSRPGHDLFVDIEVAKLLGDLLPDFLTARASRMRDTNHGAGHEATLEGAASEVKPGSGPVSEPLAAKRRGAALWL